MPQFDPATFTPQIFWLLVTFGALFLVLWRVALPKISDALEARQDKIDDDLEKAAALKQEAQGVLEEYEAAAAEGQAKAQALIREAQAAMAREADEAARHAAGEPRRVGADGSCHFDLDLSVAEVYPANESETVLAEMLDPKRPDPLEDGIGDLDIPRLDAACDPGPRLRTRT